MAPDEVLRVENLTKRYGRKTVLDDVSFSVRGGDIFGFLGPNGAGKTTTIRIVLGLIRATSGSVRLFGESRAGTSLDALARIGAMVEVPGFYGHLTGRQTLRALGILEGFEDRSGIERSLETVGLAEAADETVRTYSQGMRQRLGIAQALLNDPELVILDEPTNGLDPHGVREILRLIISLNRDKGITFLISSHQLEELEQLANRVAILRKGRLLVTDEVAAILEVEASYVVLQVEEPERARDILGKDYRLDDRAGDGLRVRADAKQLPEIVALLVNAGVGVIRAQAEKPSLTDYFLRVTRGEEADLGR